MSDFKIDLQPIAGSAGVKVQAQAVADTHGGTIAFDAKLGASFDKLSAFFAKRAEEKRKANIERGRLAQEAGNADEIRQGITDRDELVGFDIGKKFQLGLQGTNQALTEFGQQYSQALRNGASDDDRQALYQGAIDKIGKGITALELPKEYTQQLRKNALENLDLFVKTQAQADKTYAQEQFRELRTATAIDLRSKLGAAAAIGDSKAAQQSLASAYTNMVAAAVAAGHNADANAKASESIRHVVIGLIDGFDPTDKTQVAARNMLLQSIPALEQVLEADDWNALNKELNQAKDKIRDYTGVQQHFQLEELRTRALAGEPISIDQINDIRKEIQRRANAGEISLSDAKAGINLTNQIWGDAQNWKYRNEQGQEVDPVQEMAGMSLAQAIALGKEPKWYAAQKQVAMLQAQGDYTKAGLMMLPIANANRSAELAKDASEMATREFRFFMDNVSFKDFAAANGSGNAEKGWAQWLSLYKAADPVLADAYLAGLGADNAALIKGALMAKRDATLEDVMRFKEQWIRTDGATRTETVKKVINHSSDKEWNEAFGTTRHFTPWTGDVSLVKNDASQGARQFLINSTRQVLTNVSPEAVRSGAVVQNAASAMAYMNAKGLVYRSPNQTAVLSPAVNARFQQAVGVAGTTFGSEVLQAYYEKIGKQVNQNANTVVVDGNWDSDRMRFLVFHKDGSSSVVYESYADVAKTAARLKKPDTPYRKPKLVDVSFTGVNVQDAVKKYKASQQPRPKPQPKPQQTNRAPAPIRQTAPVAPPPSKRDTRTMVLQQEFANEKAAQAKHPKGSREWNERELNIKAITRELSR
jgi:hypothetical protein|nr:MAG TPA: hypothetical protein [Caudoviricetes sp.]